jgi:F-type H+-transporting ATPase subunit epsilon
LLQAGVIDIELKNGNHEVVAINWGHAKVDENSVTVLADGAVSIAGDSESQIANSLENARKLLESMSDSDFAIAAATAKIESIAKSRF